MATNSQIFRLVMSQFATGVACVTARTPEGLLGLTINSLVSVSLEPPLILFCLKKTSSSLPYFKARKAFIINILSEDQEEVASSFANPLLRDWRLITLGETVSGQPVIQGAVSYLECCPQTFYEGGDHEIILAEVTSLGVQEGASPLIFCQRRFHGLPELVSKKVA